MKKLSAVIACYRDAPAIPDMYSRLTETFRSIGVDYEIIFVNDASPDNAREVLADLAASDTRVVVVNHTRNFGSQSAFTSGLRIATGDAAILLDGDLQDPPELAPDLIARWREGYEVVYAVREDRRVEPFFRRAAIGLFYRILRRLSDVDIPPDAGDFRLVDRRALDQFRSMRENNRYVRGLFAWIGFRQIGVPYRRDARYAGETKYPLSKLVKLGADGILGFSNVPLRLTMALGFLVSGTSFVLGVVAIVLRIFGVGGVPGWASIVVVVSFLGGVQLVVTGTMGLYVARIYEEVKGRPLYIVRESHGFDAEASAEAKDPLQQTVAN